jgi:hypothetical protein
VETYSSPSSRATSWTRRRAPCGGRGRDSVRAALDARHRVERLDGALADEVDGYLELLEDGYDDPLGLVQQGVQQVHPVNLGVTPAACLGAAALQGLGGFDGQSVGAQHRFGPGSKVQVRFACHYGRVRVF